jgi:hypothetical protein
VRKYRPGKAGQAQERDSDRGGLVGRMQKTFVATKRLMY